MCAACPCPNNRLSRHVTASLSLLPGHNNNNNSYNNNYNNNYYYNYCNRNLSGVSHRPLLKCVIYWSSNENRERENRRSNFRIPNWKFQFLIVLKKPNKLHILTFWPQLCRAAVAAAWQVSVASTRTSHQLGAGVSLLTPNWDIMRIWAIEIMEMRLKYNARPQHPGRIGNCGSGQSCQIESWTRSFCWRMSYD